MNCTGSSKCWQVAATVHLGMFLITRVVIPEEHSSLETGKGPSQGHGDLFGDKTSMSWHSRTLLRHFCVGIAEGQESPTAGISGGDAVVVLVVGSPKEGTTVLEVLLTS